jgi:transposase
MNPQELRLRLAQRDLQVSGRLDELLPPNHQARAVWDYVQTLDLSPLYAELRCFVGHPGAPAADPQILFALWLLATLDGVGSARYLDQLCLEHLAYQWLAGGVSLNYHSLADFRTAHVELLDDLLTDSAAVLLHTGLAKLDRIAQDSLRNRAHAGSSSFRRQETLEECLREARTQVEALRTQLRTDPASAGAEAARQRAARERLERVEQARVAAAELAAQHEKTKHKHGRKTKEVRASTTDPEARRMKMPDGGTRPAYNVQLGTTTVGGVIVAVDVNNVGSDADQMTPLARQVAERYAQKPKEWLADGGFATLDDIEAMAKEEIVVYAPVKKADELEAAGQNPYEPKAKDSPEVAAWRVRMGTAAGKAIYRERAQTAEWVNAGMRNRGTYQFPVRGITKVRAVVLWQAIAHNMQRLWALRRQAA